MRVVKCKNGHYYDSDRYEMCPHCGSKPDEDEEGTSKESSAGYRETKPVEGVPPMGELNRRDFKTPNMNLTPEPLDDYPQTVSYGHGNFGSGGKVFDQERAPEANPTAVLNVPLMPSLGQGYFMQIPEGGQGKADDASIEETSVLTSAAVAPEKRGVRAFLTRISNGYRYELVQDRVVLGKVNTTLPNDISVDNKTVSRQHACIHKAGERYFIEDLGSTNKTLVNKIDIGTGRWIELKNSDRITLSNEEFAFSVIE